MSEWHGVPWVCEYLDDVSPTFVYRHAAQMGAVKAGGKLLFRQSDVDRWLSNQRLLPEGVTPIRKRKAR
jgi:hypothetical protein